MDGVALSVPRLTPQELADPCTIITINGISVQLWQVAHLYGLDYDIPSLPTRSGASSTDFRRLHTRARDQRTSHSNRPTDAAAGLPAQGKHHAESPTLPPSRLATRELPRELRSFRTSQSSKDENDTCHLLHLLDDLIDEAWSDGSEERTRLVTAAPASTRLETRSGSGQAYWALPGPPPTRSLPPLPLQWPSRGSGHPNQRRRQTQSTVPSIINFSRPIEFRNSSQAPRNEYPLHHREDQSITSTMPRSRLYTTAQMREAPGFLPALNQPATTSAPGTAVLGSLPRNLGVNLTENVPPRFPQLPTQPPLQQQVYRQRDAGLTERRPHVPPEVPRLPPRQQREEGKQRGQSQGPRGNPLPDISRSAFDTAILEARRTTPPAQEDEGLKSRWSPDSSPEHTAMKRVKRVFSYARLRRKS